jgi:thioredoxin-like negative regulator of GroEL
MNIRGLLTLTGIVAAILGALVVYLVLSVPNDIRADALLKEARQQITNGDETKARESLSTILQQYPRTDAAAAATVALVSIAQKENAELHRAVAQLRTENQQQAKVLEELRAGVKEIRNAPPRVVEIQGPPAPALPPTVAKAAPKKSAPAKKTTKKTTTKRRR